MGNPEDIHNFPKRYENAFQQLEKSDISKKNKELILKFGRSCKRKENKISTIAMNLNILRWIAAVFFRSINILLVFHFPLNLERRRMIFKAVEIVARGYLPGK